MPECGIMYFGTADLGRESEPAGYSTRESHFVNTVRQSKKAVEFFNRQGRRTSSII